MLPLLSFPHLMDGDSMDTCPGDAGPAQTLESSYTGRRCLQYFIFVHQATFLRISQVIC